MSAARPTHARGFSLLEVMIALVILAMSLTVILSGNVSAIASVERMEGMTQATLLARGKMLDIERELNKEGFKMDSEERDGDFKEQKHPEIKWTAKIHPIKVQTEKLMEMAESFTGLAGGDGKGDGKGGLAAAAGAAAGAAGAGAAGGMGGGMGDITQLLAPLVTPVAQGISDNMRLVQLEVSWPEGKYRSSFKVSAIVTSRALKQSNPQALPGQAGVSGMQGVVPTGLPGAMPGGMMPGGMPPGGMMPGGMMPGGMMPGGLPPGMPH